MRDIDDGIDYDLMIIIAIMVIILGIAISVYMNLQPKERYETLHGEPIVKQEEVQENLMDDIIGGHETVTVTVTEEVSEEIKEPILSDEDIMAIVAECEAGNQKLIGKVAVIATILNRCDYYGETVETVVYKPLQYAFNKEVVPSEESYLAVKIALRERDLFPSTMMWFLPSEYPSYGKPYMKIQDHYFSYLEEE